MIAPDVLPSASRVPDLGIRQLYDMDSRWQAWLDVEAALAQAQAELGMIPSDAARIIEDSARLALLDRDRIDAATARTSHTLVPLVWELARVAGDEAGGWVHWGATTQNIVQSGDLLIQRRAHDVFLVSLGRILSSMSELAIRTSDMVMAGRTHGQHAVPITFGFKVAVWIDELIRHVDRMRAAEPRVFVTMLGGATGTFASFGAEGPALQELVSARLGMSAMPVPARTIGDHLAEYVTLLGLLGGTTEKIAREVYTLMKTEYGEVEEPIPTGTVGSSTMPQKRNPHLCQDVIAFSARVRNAVPLALEAMRVEHEADRSMSLVMQDATRTACVATGEILSRLELIISELEVDPERMAKNVKISQGLIMAESVMLDLGGMVGRQAAHEVVYDAAQTAGAQGGSFLELLRGDARVTEHVSSEALTNILSPERYTGLSADLSKTAARRGVACASEIAEVYGHADRRGAQASRDL